MNRTHTSSGFTLALKQRSGGAGFTLALKQRSGSAGFTLVELAISLMIIGLLIGGVLKGKELVDNAKVTQTIRQIQTYDTAAKSFNAVYGFLPGDIPDPTRIPGCTGDPCGVAGDQNGLIGTSHYAPYWGIPAAVLTTGEPRNFFVHLIRANMLGGGVDLTTTMATAPGTNWIGTQAPAAALGENVAIGMWGYNSASPAGIRGPHYILRGWSDAGEGITPVAANFIDQKIDDGKANTGGVFALNRTSSGAFPTTCADGTTFNYLVSRNIGCNLAIKADIGD